MNLLVYKKPFFLILLFIYVLIIPIHLYAKGAKDVQQDKSVEKEHDIQTIKSEDEDSQMLIIDARDKKVKTDTDIETQEEHIVKNSDNIETDDFVHSIDELDKNDIEKKTILSEEEVNDIVEKTEEMLEKIDVDQLFKEEMLSYIFDTHGALRLVFIGETETMSVSRGKKSVNATIYLGEKNIIERKYDALFRVIREMVWSKDIKDTGEDKPLLITFYYYDDKSFTPSKTEKESEEEKVVTLFNKDGTIQNITYYALDDTLMFSETYEYDKEKRVILFMRRYSPDKIEKIRYLFVNENKSPNIKQSINDVLIYEKIYTHINEWKSIVYFDGGFVVRTYYVDGLKTKEEYLYNDKIVRTRTF